MYKNLAGEEKQNKKKSVVYVGGRVASNVYRRQPKKHKSKTVLITLTTLDVK